MITIAGVRYEPLSARVSRGLAGVWRVLMHRVPFRRHGQRFSGTHGELEELVLVEYFDDKQAALRCRDQLHAMPRGTQLKYFRGRLVHERDGAMHFLGDAPPPRQRTTLRE